MMSEGTTIIFIICITILSIYALTIVFVFSKGNTKVDLKGKREDNEISVTIDKKEKDN